MECGTRLGVYHFFLLLSAAQILAIGKKSTKARFLLFFYSIDIDTLEVELEYI